MHMLSQGTQSVTNGRQETAAQLLPMMPPTDFQAFTGASFLNFTPTANFLWSGKYKQNLYFFNDSAFNVYISAFLCKARKDTDSADATANFIDPDSAFRLGFSYQQTDAGNVFYSNIGVTPYENAAFLEYWRILKRKNFTLKINGEKVLKFKRSFEFQHLLANKTATQAAMQHRTYNWLILIRGPPATTVASTTVATFATSKIGLIQQSTYTIDTVSDQIPDTTISYYTGVNLSTNSSQKYGQWNLGDQTLDRSTVIT